MGFSIGVYLDDQTLEKVKKTAEKSFRGKVSAYIASLVEADCEGGHTTEPLSPNILRELSKSLCGEYHAERLTKALGDSDQPRELARILYARASPHWRLPPETLGEIHMSVASDEDMEAFSKSAYTTKNDLQRLEQQVAAVAEQVAAYKRAKSTGPKKRSKKEVS